MKVGVFAESRVENHKVYEDCEKENCSRLTGEKNYEATPEN